MEEFLGELVFDYDDKGIEKVFLKLRKSVSKLPVQDLDPSSFSDLLESFDLKAQVGLASVSLAKICSEPLSYKHLRFGFNYLCKTFLFLSCTCHLTV